MKTILFFRLFINKSVLLDSNTLNFLSLPNSNQSLDSCCFHFNSHRVSRRTHFSLVWIQRRWRQRLEWKRIISLGIRTYFYSVDCRLNCVGSQLKWTLAHTESNAEYKLFDYVERWIRIPKCFVHQSMEIRIGERRRRRAEIMAPSTCWFLSMGISLAQVKFNQARPCRMLEIGRASCRERV